MQPFTSAYICVCSVRLCDHNYCKTLCKKDAYVTMLLVVFMLIQYSPSKMDVSGTVSRFTNLMNKCIALIIDVPFPHNLHILDGTVLPKDPLHICLPSANGVKAIALTLTYKNA